MINVRYSIRLIAYDLIVLSPTTYSKTNPGKVRLYQAHITVTYLPPTNSSASTVSCICQVPHDPPRHHTHPLIKTSIQGRPSGVSDKIHPNNDSTLSRNVLQRDLLI